MSLESIENECRVSVAMAVYNGEKYLREQLDSILNQLSDCDELVISLDPSSDTTSKILNEYVIKDFRVKVYNNKYSPGVVHNFQNALEHTSGKIVFYADQDDVWCNNKIENVLNAFNDPSIGVVIHDACLVDENLNIISNSFFKLRGGARSSLLGNLFRLSYIGCSMAFRAKYKPIILPIPTIYRSHDWWTGSVCVCAKGKMKILYESLILHRIHSSNVTPKHRPSLYYQVQVRFIIVLNLLLRIFKLIKYFR